MLTKKEFKKKFVKCCREELNDRGMEGMEIIPRKVQKAQRGVLNGLIFKPEGSLCAPTFYVEQFYPLYLEGRSIASLSRDAVEAVIGSLDLAALFGSLDTYDPIKSPENLRVRMLNISRNCEYLRDIPHLGFDCGFALIAEMVSGEYRAVINNELFELLGLSKDELFENALQNSAEKNPAILWRLTAAAAKNPDKCVNLLDTPDENAGKDDVAVPPAENDLTEYAGCDIAAENSCCNTAGNRPAMYVLSNQKTFWGAAALFYPGVIGKLHELLAGDFYIIPSSVHELIVLPVSEGDPEMLQAMIKDANETVVDCEDVLSDDLYVCRSGEVLRISTRSGVMQPEQFVS